ncbi:xanthine dehydrogenase accessory factor [Chitinophaga sp. CF118]|uniref:XdhC family protein n=1 Tax=Chitinophaga sp. CF118 TaxID=1884367 RepID=UPI0008E363DA|nr:XdhC/CoxI family protein [Chitinophaga sp. CF118]SFD60719.1 xanthine dehydrogenase accessory factor [Chitinophaga sp. CF118]
MQKKLATWELITKSLQQHIPVMLLYVLQSHGSSPGRQGFAMAVAINGEMEGSIGGGIMEHKFVEMAKALLQHRHTPPSLRQQVHDKSSSHQSGMICSGDQTIFLYQVQPTDLHTIKNIMQAQHGALQLSPAGISFMQTPISRDSFYFIMQSEEDWCYQELLGYQHKLYIIGGGHCSLALSRIMRMMDFYIHVFDNRPDLHTMQQNHDAHEKTVLNDYEELQNLIPAGLQHYVVIMTLGYRTDDIALRSLMDKKFGYLGVLGSQAKIHKMFTDYSAAGIPQEMLSRLHAPVGIQIKSQTPEEIAVSIAAEIIQVKNVVF